VTATLLRLTSGKRSDHWQPYGMLQQQALQNLSAVNGVMKDHTQFFKMFQDSPDFRRFVSDTVLGYTFCGKFIDKILNGRIL
jgi:hypothetical protein